VLLEIGGKHRAALAGSRAVTRQRGTCGVETLLRGSRILCFRNTKTQYFAPFFRSWEHAEPLNMIREERNSPLAGRGGNRGPRRFGGKTALTPLAVVSPLRAIATKSGGRLPTIFTREERRPSSSCAHPGVGPRGSGFLGGRKTGRVVPHPPPPIPGKTPIRSISESGLFRRPEPKISGTWISCCFVESRRRR